MNPERITFAVDENTLEILNRMSKEENISRSKLVREAIRFYNGSKKLREHGTEKLDTYLELLSEGEHVVLDVDHWLLFLDVLESSSEREKFWKKSKEVANSHADQLASKIQTPEDLLKRLAACNFFRLNKLSDNEFTLILNSETARKFVKKLLEDFSKSMELEMNIQEDIGKLRVKSKRSKT